VSVWFNLDGFGGDAMARGDRDIYVQFKGKLTKVAEPKGNPENANFVITWNGRDWSGFRTLAECEKQFGELEGREDDPFAVVERF
jgi:hypothetical protein